MNKRAVLISLLLISVMVPSCAVVFDKLYGESKPRERVVAKLPENHIDYWQDVKPVLEQRCVVCHSCYDAACQLKMTAIEGIERGATKAQVYDATRITHAPLTRLFEDGISTAQWREKGFFPVLNEHDQNRTANEQASLMYQVLALKEKHPLPQTEILSDDFTFGYEREQICPTPNEMELYTKQNPLWGMPYALPSLASSEQATLKTWLSQGAYYTAREPLSQAYLTEIEKWEDFLNGPSRKKQLTNRYIYEHLFLANIYFEELTEKGQAPQFFKLIRSSTAPGTPPEQIATRRPYDDPKVSRVYYRLVPMLEAVVSKSHLPYALNAWRMNRWHELFVAPKFEVNSMPHYSPKVAANPFASFHAIPMESRYKFMLDEAHFIIDNFIKGPVCRGQVAVNVIRDHFWVFFVNPDLPINYKLAKEIDIYADALELPSAQDDIFMPLSNWVKYSKKAKKTSELKNQFIIENFVSEKEAGAKIDLDIIWSGQSEGREHNQSAALTVFRHYDNASVYKGLFGDEPQTAWVIDYPLLEKIYYLLVAGYDVYGNVGHQLLSRLYMDFLRMDGEDMFLDFLPENTRKELLAQWYSDSDEKLIDYLYDPEFYKYVGTSVSYSTGKHQTQLYEKLKKHLGQSVNTSRSITQIKPANIQAALSKLSQFKGESVALLSELSLVEITQSSGDSIYVSLLKNNAHKSITSMFSEDAELWPEKHNISVLNGIGGSYPNTFMQVNADNIDAWVKRLLTMKTEEDYASMMSDYGIRRTHPKFWAFSDRIHAYIQTNNAIEAGFLDYNRLENR